MQAPRLLEESIEASRSVNIIDEKEIKLKNQQTVADILRDVPGVEVVRQGPLGQTTSIFIRGARSEDTLVLIDGAEVNDAIAPSRGYDFSSLSPANIERIEVYRGPQSVRFGAGALGGVVNIVTKEGIGSPHGLYSVEGGSYETLRGSAGFLGKTRQVGYSLTVDGFQTHGFSSADVRDGNSERDGEKNATVSSKLTWVPDSISKVSATFRYIKTGTDLDVHGGVGGDDPNDTANSTQLVGSIEGQRRFFSERLKSTLGFYYSEMNRSDTNPVDAVNPNDSWDRFLSENQKLESNHEFSLTDHHSLRLNLQWRNQSGGSTSGFNGTPTIVARQEQSNLGEAVTYLYESSSWFGDAGLRFDEQSKIGTIPSERVSIGHDFVTSGTRLSFTYGSGFKAPSLYQLYSQYGTSSLHWESSDTYEFTIEQKWLKDLNSSIALFQNRFHNMIDFDQTTMKYLNVSSARSQGLEIQVKTSLSQDWSVDSNYTYLDARDESQGTALVRRPRHAANAKLIYRRASWEAYSQIHFEGERPDTDPVTLKRVIDTGYATINLGGSYEVSRILKLHARIENLLDRKYQEVAGYGTSGFSFYLGGSGEIW